MKKIIYVVLCFGFITSLLSACEYSHCELMECYPLACNEDPNSHPGCGVNCGRTCTTYQNAASISCILSCNENGCDCNDGYVLDEVSDLCVHPEDCPKCSNGDRNGSPGCGVNCGRTCSTYQSTEQVFCPDICEVNGCDCNVGFVLDERTHRCVRPEECSLACNEDPNSHPGCGVNCGRTCTTYQNAASISCILSCNENGCDCNDGYVLDEVSDLCVHPEDCPKCSNGDRNGSPGCGVNCGRTCSTYQSTEQVFCPDICDVNGCDCNVGFVLDERTHRCVRPEECSPRCPEGEVYSTCPSSSDYCLLQDPNRYPIFTPAVCGKPRCECGFNRKRSRKTNECIAASACPPFPCRKHEKYSNCPPNCPGEKCSDYINNSTCPRFGRIGIVVACEPQCRCAKGYYRDGNNNCVPAAQCQVICSGPNEYFDCGSACDNVCFDLEIQNKTSCPIINIVCTKMCYCKDGYARDKEGICVKFKDCPPKCTRKNEVYSTCASGCEKTCDSIGAPESETCVAAAVCSTACVCLDGYYRNNKGECVLKSECTSCNKDPNSVPGCGVYCNQRCSDVGRTKPRPCPRICKVNGCDCKPGFYLDENTNKCVNECDCTYTTNID